MPLYVLGRLAAAVPTLMIVAIFIFGLVHIAPGDPALLIAGDNANPEQVDRIRERLHLDRSLPVQFGIWAGNAVQGDLGTSVYSGRPVMELIAQRVEPTFLLALYTIILTVVIAVPLGTVAAWKANGWLDRERTILESREDFHTILLAVYKGENHEALIVFGFLDRLSISSA